VEKLLIAVLLLIPFMVWAGEVQLQFTPPTEYSDGSALPASDIKEYRIYAANTAGGPYTQIGTIPGTDAQATIDVDRQLDWYFVLTTVTTGGLESVYSNEASKLHAEPNPPTGVIAITITVQVQ
jgi:hypothetical protein